MDAGPTWHSSTQSESSAASCFPTGAFPSQHKQRTMHLSGCVLEAQQLIWALVYSLWQVQS
jgi:hypothetical protein